MTLDAKGMVTSSTINGGQKWTMAYDSWGQPTSYTGPGGVGNQTWEYDELGNMVSATPAGGPTLTMSYSGDRLVALRRGNEIVGQWTYDDAGLVLTVVDATGKTTRMGYDGAGNQTSLDDGTGAPTKYEYNPANQLTRLTNANGGTRSWTYDVRGNVTSMIDELGARTTYVYDDAGRRESRTDRDGVVTTYSYDKAGHEVAKQVGGKATSTTYDGFGRRIAAVSPTASMSWTYNAASQVTSTSTTGPGLPDINFSYTWCACGRPDTVTGPGGQTVYEYEDDSGNLTSVTAPDGSRFGYAFDSAGRLVSMTRPNGVTDTLSWNSHGLLAARNQVGRTGTVVTGVSYGYDVAGRRTSVEDAAGTHAFSHDADGNLALADHPDGFDQGDESFGYDQVGNRVADSTNPVGSMVYDAANRLLRDARHAYVYDREGNLTSKMAHTSGAVTRFVWDTDHRLLRVIKPGGGEVSYRYDPEGRRIAVTRTDGSSTVFAYDGMHVAATWSIEAAGQPAILDDVFVTDPGGTPLMATDRVQTGETTNAPVFPVLDGLGSVIGGLGDDGSLATSTTYSAFGRPLATAEPGIGNGVYGFTGHAWDKDLELWQARARWFDSSTGHFITEDPIAAVNLYPYVLNMPLDYIDENGEELGLALLKKFAAAACMAAVLHGPVTGTDTLKQPTKIVETCVKDAAKRNRSKLSMEAAMRAMNAYRAGTLR